MSTVTRAKKRAMARQIFHELMADEFSHERSGLPRQTRRKIAWMKAKLIANGFVKYADHKAEERSTAKAELVRASDFQIDTTDDTEIVLEGSEHNADN